MNKVEDSGKDLTAETIFNKHSWKALGAISPSKSFCLAAMEEYADLKVKQASLPVSPVTTDEEKLNYFRAGYKYYRSFYSSITTFDDDSEETVKVGFNEFLQSLNKTT